MRFLLDEYPITTGYVFGILTMLFIFVVDNPCT